MHAAGVGASVRFAAESAGHRADIELVGARSGQRTLSDDGADCRELAGAAALTLAILIDPSFVPPGDTSSTNAAPAAAGSNLTAAIPAATASPASPPSPVVDSGPRVDRRRESSASLFAGAGMASRLTRPLLPALSGGVALDLVPSFGVRALALWVPPSRVDLPPGEVELALLVGAVEACLHFAPTQPSARLSACGGASGGRIHAAGKGYDQDLESDHEFFAVQAGLSGDLPLSEPFGVFLDGRGYYAFTQNPLEVTGEGEVHPTKNPGFSALTGLRLRLF
jgi:hypothetical protein